MDSNNAQKPFKHSYFNAHRLELIELTVDSYYLDLVLRGSYSTIQGLFVSMEEYPSAQHTYMFHEFIQTEMHRSLFFYCNNEKLSTSKPRNDHVFFLVKSMW